MEKLEKGLGNATLILLFLAIICILVGVGVSSYNKITSIKEHKTVSTSKQQSNINNFSSKLNIV